MLRYLLTSLLAASNELGQDAGSRALWQQMLDGLPAIPTTTANGRSGLRPGRPRNRERRPCHPPRRQHGQPRVHPPRRGPRPQLAGRRPPAGGRHARRDELLGAGQQLPQGVHPGRPGRLSRAEPDRPAASTRSPRRPTPTCASATLSTAWRSRARPRPSTTCSCRATTAWSGSSRCGRRPAMPRSSGSARRTPSWSPAPDRRPGRVRGHDQRAGPAAAGCTIRGRADRSRYRSRAAAAVTPAVSGDVVSFATQAGADLHGHLTVRGRHRRAGLAVLRQTRLRLGCINRRSRRSVLR